jgi:DNA-binding NarL/FixJ family response regulator
MNNHPNEGNPKSARTRILIVDDHPIVREGLAAVIQRQRDLVCCGEADGSVAALAAVSELKPDLVIVDLRLRSGDGLELIKSLKAQDAAVRILVVSQFDEIVYAERAIRAGAQGYLMKEQASQEVISAIRAILAGGIYASPRVSALALRRLSSAPPPGQRDGIVNLTDRELQVFQLLGAGLGTRQIAQHLSISIKTIETHRQSIKSKLELPGASELVRYATDWVRAQTGPLPPALGNEGTLRSTSAARPGR